jgi:hypothetical protein
MLDISAWQHQEEKTESCGGYDCQSQDQIQHYDNVASRKRRLTDMQSQVKHIFEKYVSSGTMLVPQSVCHIIRCKCVRSI